MRHLGARHAGKDFGGADIVRRGIVRQIGDIDAEADLGGEMQHGVDAFQRPVDGFGVAHIGDEKVGAVERRGFAVRMHIRPQ